MGLGRLDCKKREKFKAKLDKWGYPCWNKIKHGIYFMDAGKHFAVVGNFFLTLPVELPLFCFPVSIV